MPEPILYDTHMHTPLCKHATGEPEEYAARAAARGLAGVIVTCHNPAPGWSPQVRMDIDEFDAYCALVERARVAWSGRVDVRLGIETDFVPGQEEWIERFLKNAPFHYVLGSVHCQLREYRERFFSGDVLAFQTQYFSHLADAAETGLFDCISHPDLVKNTAGESWDFEIVRPVVMASLDRIAATGVAMELNTSGRYKRVKEMNPGPEMLRAMREREIPVVVGSDSHVPERVGEGFEEAFDLLEAAGYAEVRYFLERKPVTVPLAAARASLRPDDDA